MPRCVRNFWIDGSIDGRKTDLSVGPRSKDGGMDLIIKQRSIGCVTTAFRVKCIVTPSGNLITSVFDDEGHLVASLQTKR